MEALNSTFDAIKYNKKFGVITPQQIILNTGKIPNKIYFESISRVNLIKSRVFYSNIVMLTFCIIAVTSLFFIKNMHLALKVFISILAITSLIIAFVHKFYFYKIVIHLKNNETHKVKATQFHRDCIKDFYFSILKRVRKDKQELFNFHSA